MFLVLTGCSGSKSDGKNETPQNETSGSIAAPDVKDSAAAEYGQKTLVDNEYCTLTIEGLEKDPVRGYVMKLSLENKTDKEVLCSFDEVSVNGYMCDPMWAASVSPGMKSNSEAVFSMEDLEKIGVSEPFGFEFQFIVFDSKDMISGTIFDDHFSYGVAGGTSSIMTDNMQLVFENDDCAMYVAGFAPDDFWGYTMTVYLENRSEKDLMFSADGVAVNGYICDPLWGTPVAAGKKAVDDVTWTDSEFEKYGITDVEVITFPVTVFDYDDWFADRIVDETFTITP